jgi:hypothetical protein
MKSFWSEKDQKLITIKSSNPKSQYDELPLPSGVKVSDVDPVDLGRQLAFYGVPGVTANNSLEKNLKAYHSHLEGIRTRAAEKAVADWLRSQPAPARLIPTLATKGSVNT